MTTSDSTTPLNHCSRGNQCVHPMGCWQPATEDYFRRRSDRGGRFASECRACGRARCKADYRRNKEKRREYARCHSDARKRYAATYNATYYSKHRDRLREKARQNARANSDALNAKRRTLRQINGDVVRQRHNTYRNTHRDQFRAYNLRRLARKRALADTFTISDWERVLRAFDSCAYCGKTVDTYHADHFIPLSDEHCPGTIPTNIVCACPSCNSSKHDHDPSDWLPRKFGQRRAKQILARILAYFDSLK